MKRCFYCAILIGMETLCLFSAVQAALPKEEKLRETTAYVVNGQVVKNEDVQTLSAQEHYRCGIEALNAHRWIEALDQFNFLISNYPLTTYGQEAYFFLAVSYYYLNEYDFANEAFTSYLKCQSNPRYFLETIEYKYAIAEQFRCGARRRCFGVRNLPKWASGTDLALKLYDEVAIAMPHDDIAAQALFSKACLLWTQQEYRESVDAFKMVIRRFNKHELAPESYLCIHRLYLEQSKIELQNPDLLDFAQINLRKFQSDFPNDERVADAEANVLAIKEVYARGLYNTADFYHRIRKHQAAVIYYQKAMAEFPETITADWCRRRLLKLCPEALDVSLPSQSKGEDIDLSDRTDINEMDFRLN